MSTSILCGTCCAHGTLAGGVASLPCGHKESFYFPLNDQRTPTEKWLWEKLGPPLYYCAECLRTVKVTPIKGQEPKVERKCAHTGQIIAPRKAVVAGKGGMNLATRARVAWDQAKAAVTGRCA